MYPDWLFGVMLIGLLAFQVILVVIWLVKKDCADRKRVVEELKKLLDSIPKE